MRLTVDDFLDWKNGKVLDYARTTVRGKRLRFEVTLSQHYIVTWGEDTVYSGNDLREAIEQFNKIAT